MHTNGAIKTLILLCVGLLIGVCCYAAFSGTLSPQQDPEQEQEQENENMHAVIVTTLPKETCDKVAKIADYYDMGVDEAMDFLLKIGLADQESFIAQAEAWDKRVQEMDE